MTKKQRSDLVLLLRCAADIAISYDRCSSLGLAAGRLDMLGGHPIGDGHWSRLLDGVVMSHPHRGWWVCGAGYEFCLLEAAARIEEGWTP